VLNFDQKPIVVHDDHAGGKKEVYAGLSVKGGKEEKGEKGD
jgi:hypothetical protein